MHKLKFYFLTTLLLAAPLIRAETLKVLNWDHYIDPALIKAFEAKYKVNVEYQTYDDIQPMISKLTSPEADYDLVFPSSHLVPLLAEKNIVRPLDESRLTYRDDIKPVLKGSLNREPDGKVYSFPYFWGTTGIGYNSKLLKAAGVDTDHISWKDLFDPEVLDKAASCGIGVINNRDELIGAALIYLGYSPNSEDRQELKQAGEVLEKTLAKVKYLHSAQYITDLANNHICMALGYSGEIISESGKNPDVHFSVPEEGSDVWVDVMTIPTTSQHQDLAYEFINFISSPQVAGQNSDYNAYPSPLKSADQYVSPAVRDNPLIYPEKDMQSRLKQISPASERSRRMRQRLWVKAMCASRDWCMSPMDNIL